jgi:hypothetical protein
MSRDKLALYWRLAKHWLRHDSHDCGRQKTSNLLKMRARFLETMTDEKEC